MFQRDGMRGNILEIGVHVTKYDEAHILNNGGKLDNSIIAGRALVILTGKKGRRDLCHSINSCKNYEYTRKNMER